MAAPDTAALDFVHPQHPVGWRRLVPSAVLADQLGEQEHCRVALETMRGERHVVARVRVTNSGKVPLKLRAIRWTADASARAAVNALAFPDALEPFYFATENFRGDYIGTCTVEGDRYFRPMPTETVTLGWSEDFTFPGVFVGSGVQPIGCLCAAASAERFHLKFRLRGGDGRTRGFEIEELPQGVEWIEVAPGETVQGERVFFGIVETNDAQHATGDYFEVLRAAGAFTRNATNPLVTQRIWCSWNYDFLADISEEKILAQLPVIVERFPMVKFVQVDHGWERVHADGTRAMIDSLYGTDASWDATRFPGGPGKLVSAIKAAGLRPATWLGLWASESSELVHDHPDWLLLDDAGRRLCFRPPGGVDGAGSPGYAVLDPSVDAVRDYLEEVCRTVFDDWGFEGVKLDFFSFAFQCRRARFRRRLSRADARDGKTALEYLRWLVELFRAHLPADGFLGLCSVAGTGSPVLGWGADYHRTGIDIGLGRWDLARRIAVWTVNTNMLLAQRPVLQNIDSVGYSDGFDERQWRTWLNLCAISGAALEVSGDLTKLDARRSARLNRVLELSDPARRVWCLDVPRGSISHAPALWLAEGARDRLIGVFNWTDGPCNVHFGPLDGIWPDWYDAMDLVWDDERLHLNPEEVDLEAHASVLLRSEKRP